MTNSEKYKTAEEREKEFYAYCKELKCGQPDHICTIPTWRCALRWLDLEAEYEKPLPCPCCGGSVVVGHKTNIHGEKFRQVWCKDEERCGYECSAEKTETEAIAAHNRFARAAMEAGEKEEK